MTEAWLDPVREAAAMILIALGAIGIVAGAIGLLRLPDVYARTHAAAFLDGAPLLVLAIGLAVAGTDARVGLAILLLAAVRMALAPAALQAVLAAARALGLAPRLGAHNSSALGKER